jgi:type I restriction enzyme S subunit
MVADVPKIRFKGFSDDWEQRKLGEITESYSGGTPTAGKKEYYDGDIPFIRSGEINSEKTELFITDEGLNSSSAKMVKKGDILYALYGATSGEVSISKLKGAINQAILAIQPHQNYDSQFLMQWLRKSKENIIGTYLQGGQGNLSGNIVKELIIDVPTHEEQKEIGAYLKNIDHLITLHERKRDETIELKKYMLQKMFPQKGKKIPEIRFAGFSGDWEQRKLSEIADKVTEKNKRNEFSEPFTNSAEHGIIMQKDYFDREVVNQENLDGYYIVRKNDFVYNPRISVTAPVGPINRNRLGKIGVMSPLYTVFRTHGIDHLYLEFYYKTTGWHRFMELNGDSGARFDRFTISSSKFMEMPIPLPNVDEQRKIGGYFESLDYLITLHQRKSDELKEVKKFMLQNMFPKKG